jgi:hypothetical protein
MFQCRSCNDYMWDDESEYMYLSSGSGQLACPACESPVKKVVGPVDEEIVKTLPDSGSLSVSELIEKTGHSEEIVTESLRHLIDMSYVMSTPNWEYSLGDNGRKLKESLED